VYIFINRTDKGVHAVAQCCAMKLLIPTGGTSEFKINLNNILPPEIRVQTISKSSKHFNAKIECTKRNYEYLMPTYIFTDAEVVNKFLLEAMVLQGDVVDAGRSGIL